MNLDTHQLVPLKPKNDNSENMIPLINIVFLLLIFFMVAGQMTWLGQLKLELPLSVSKKVVDKSHLTIAQDASGQLYFEGEIFSLETFSTKLQDTLKQAELRERPVNLSLDKGLHAKDLDALLNILREVGVQQVTLFTKAIEH